MSTAYTIGIIVFDGVLTSEVLGPAEVFALASQGPALAGSRVLLIGVEPQASIRTDEGLRLLVDMTLAEAPQLDVLLVPGGSQMDPLLDHAGLNTFIQRQAARAQWTASVCAGAFLLGRAGVLDGRRATTWFGGETSLQQSFPAIQVVHDQPVVVDQRRLTANGGVVSYQAALILLGRLAGTETARAVYDNLGLARLEAWPTLLAQITQP